METTINLQSRNLGLAWATDGPAGDNLQPFSVPDVPNPDYVGGVRSIEQGLEKVAELSADGTHHNIALFVGDKPVEAIWDTFPQPDPESAEGKYSFQETWVKTNIDNLVSRLRQGETLKVKLKE